MRSWDIFREVGQMQRDMDAVLRSLGLGHLPGSGGEPGVGLREWPRVNLREDADHIAVEALLPGVDPERIDLNVLGNTLTIAGERGGFDSAHNGRSWHRRERGAGRFLRTIELPVEINPDQVKAEYKNGLLLVTLPKVEEAKPKRISIKVR